MRGEGGLGDRESGNASPRCDPLCEPAALRPPDRGGQSPCEQLHSTLEAAPQQPARCLPPWSSTARRLPSRPGTAGAVGGKTTSAPCCRSEHQGPHPTPGQPGVSISKGQGVPGSRAFSVGWDLGPWGSAVDTAWAPRPGQRPRQSKVQMGLKRQQGCRGHWQLQVASRNPQRGEMSLKTSRLVSGGSAGALGAPGPWLQEDFWTSKCPSGHHRPTGFPKAGSASRPRPRPAAQHWTWPRPHPGFPLLLVSSLNLSFAFRMDVECR